MGDFAVTKTDDDYQFALPKLPDTKGDGCCGKWQGCTNESTGCLFIEKKAKMREQLTMYTMIICNSDGSLGRHEHQTLQDIEIRVNNALYNMPDMIAISLIKE